MKRSHDYEQEIDYSKEGKTLKNSTFQLTWLICKMPELETCFEFFHVTLKAIPPFGAKKEHELIRWIP